MTVRLRLVVAVAVLSVAVAWPLSAPASAAAACDPATQLCVTIDATQTRGPALLRAQGFLYGVFDDPPNLDIELIRALKPQHWRTTYDHRYYDGSKGEFGGAMTWTIRGEWWHAHGGNNGPPPSRDFEAYETFVRELVRKHIAQGRPVDYWDVFNETDIGRVQTPECGGSDPCTNITYLEEIRHAVKAIREVDPDAKIVVPSTSLFREGMPAAGLAGTQLDLVTVLDYMVLHDIRIDAISWHELNSIYYNAGRVVSPRSTIDHIARARALIAARPSLGNLEIHVNEYTSPFTEGHPGWEAGFIGALEDADVDRANRSCWPVLDPDGTWINGCVGTQDYQSATLDQLFNHDGSTRAVYWVHRFYADMTGARVSATTAAPSIPVQGDDDVERNPAFVQDPTDGSFWSSAYATRDDTTSTLRVLVGRHYSCSHDGVNPCAPTVPNDEGNRPVAPTVAGVAMLTWPYARGNTVVTVERIPRVIIGTVPEPTIVSHTTIPVENGQQVQVPLGPVADGEAYTITVEPDTTAPVVPELPASPALVVIAAATIGLAMLVRRRGTGHGGAAR